MTPAPSAAAFWTVPGRVRLRTLVVLRWMAVAGQSAAVLLVHFGLGFELPLAAALGAIALSANLNIFLMLTRPNQEMVSEGEAALQLGYDLLQLGLLLGLTGGVANPFLPLLIAPLAVSATVLRPSVTVVLALMTCAVIAMLYFFGMPLPWKPGESLELPRLYQIGLATAALISLAFTSVYAWRVASEEERLNDALAAVQIAMAREQELSAVGGLAAAAAHALGTPLATIHLVAKEMVRQTPAESPLREDIELLVSQSERCRGILKQLVARKPAADALHDRLHFATLLELAAERHQGLGRTISIRVEPQAGVSSREPELQRKPEILHGIGNLIENAIGFASDTVEVIGRWSDTDVSITVRDDGPGFPANVLTRLGEPYISERAPGDTGGGLGLGFFIAKTLLERTGASVEARNRTLPRTGALIRATWRRAQIEAPPLS